MRYKDIIPKAKQILPEAESFLQLSFLMNLITGLLKLFTGILSASITVIINGIYSIVLCAAKLLQLLCIRISGTKGSQGSTKTTRALNAAAIILLGVIFTLSGMYTYRSEKALLFGVWSIFILAVCTFVKLALSIYGVAKFRHDRDNVMFSVKMTNLTDALMSLVITQSAILSLCNREDAYVYDGIYGALTGIVVTLIGTGMLIYLWRSENKQKESKIR